MAPRMPPRCPCAWVGRGEPGSARQLGLTLLEVATSLALLSVILVPIGMVTVTFTRTASEGHLLARLSERNRSALQRLVDDLEPAMAGSTAIANSGKTLLLAQPAPFSGGAPVAGTIIQYDLQAAADDPANGLDDNGNNVVDEFELIRTDLSTVESVVISSDIDGSASLFTAVGNGVRVTLAHIGTVPQTTNVGRLAKSVLIHPKN